MAFVNHPMEESEKSLRDYASPRCEDIKEQESDSKLCWRIKDISTYDPQAYGPTPFSPRDSQGSCQSAEQGDYKRSIYLYSVTTKTLTMIRLENDYTTLERTIKLTR
jgi:hypothetical protein